MTWHPKFIDHLHDELLRMIDNYRRDPSFAHAVDSSVSASHPTAQSVMAAQAAMNAGKMAMAAPPAPKQPWESWDDAKRAVMDKAIEDATGIINYRNGVKSGNPIAASLFAQYARKSQLVDAQGGIDPELATTLARYRMYKQGTADIPTGPPTPLPSKEQINANNAAFFTTEPGSPERKAHMDASKAAIARQAELFFDSLAAPPAQPPEQQPAQQDVPVPTASQPNQPATTQGA